jgi:hypothetical protein
MAMELELELVRLTTLLTSVVLRTTTAETLSPTSLPMIPHWACQLSVVLSNQVYTERQRRALPTQPLSASPLSR